MESALYSIYALVVFVSEISLVRFLIQKRVHKYHTPTLSTKYSLYMRYYGPYIWSRLDSNVKDKTIAYNLLSPPQGTLTL